MALEFHEVSPGRVFEPVSTRKILQDGKVDGKTGGKTAPVQDSRRQERNKAIVQAAIESVSKQSTSISRKRSYSTHASDTHSTLDPATKSAKKPNAFSKMMAASKKSQEWAPEAIDSRIWTQMFEQALDEMERRDPIIGPGQWATIVSQGIVRSVDALIMSRVSNYSCTNSKINALHALIEMSMAIAYAPRSEASDTIRSGNIPAFLVNEMWKVANMMSELDIKRLFKEEALHGKVRELRQHPLVEWEGDTWKGLDDILRVLNLPGPVDFRRVYQGVEQVLSGDFDSIKAEKWIRNAIQKEISKCVGGNSCFETKYNAMNALVDIGASLVEKPLGHYLVHFETVRSAHETLVDAMFRIGKLLDFSEIDQILTEMYTKPELSSPTFLQDLQRLIDPDSASGNDYSTRYAMAMMLEQHVKEKRKERVHDYCKNGLLAKILHLRLNNRSSKYYWGSSWDVFDDTIELFIDSSVPLAFDQFFSKIDHMADKLQMYYCDAEEMPKKFRKCVDHSIARILMRASGRACIETKLNALVALTKIGLRIMECASPARPPWHNSIFADHLSEDSVTDAMMSICHSLAKLGRVEAVLEQDWLNDMKELDNRRTKIPEAMEGLDAVLSVLQDPGLLSSKNSKRAKVAAISKITHVIDLTGD